MILLAHGDGGLLSRRLVEELFLKYFRSPLLHQLPDAAVFTPGRGEMALTTDSFVVNPLFFPGGDIGKLSVCGTVNDLAVSGAHPQHITTSFIIEEGFSLARLEAIVSSMAAACAEAGVSVVAGDTKVVPAGHADQVFITTAGTGTVPPGRDPGYHRLQPGDKVIVNGAPGSHGLTILSAREGLGLEGSLHSDCAPLNHITGELWSRCRGMRIMRDLTRGGLATAAGEIAGDSGLDIRIKESLLPADPAIQGAAEILGLDSLYLANEGKFLAVVAAEEAGAALEIIKNSPYGKDAAVIGEIQAGRGKAYLETALGGTRTLELAAGTPLPRIC